jgi:hypothetical protein
MVKAGVSRDSKKPLLDCIWTMNCLDIPVSLKINILSKVFGVRGISGEAEANPEDIFPESHQFLEESRLIL